LLPIFHTPDWVLRALVVLLALGFLPALVMRVTRPRSMRTGCAPRSASTC
jgi:hypothetical protein